MKRVLTAVMLMSLAGVPFLAGCDKTVSDDSTVKKNADGTVTKDETKVTQQPDGTTVKKEEQSKS